MDKEAQEKIAEILIRRNRTLRAFGQNPTALHDADNILALIKELGYCKLEGKPPIKTDDLASSAEELQGNAQFINSGLVAQIQHVMWESRKAQRDSDIKWDGGKE